VWFFITRHQRRMGRQIKRVPRVAMEALQRYDWPGNCASYKTSSSAR